MSGASGNQRRLAAGDVLFEMGDEGDAAYIVDEGAFDVYVVRDGQEVLLNEVRAGELVGEMALIDGRHRSASVRAKVPSVVTRISEEALKDRLGRADPVVQLLLGSTVDRLRQRLEPDMPELSPVDADGSEPAEAANQSAQQRLRLESELETAVRERQFVMHYQPIAAMPGGEIAGFEALVRWQHPERGLVPPGQFVQAVEESHLMADLGRWILQESAEALVRFQELTSRELFMGINVSGKQLDDASFLDDLERLTDLPVAPSQIKLEITESLLLTNANAIGILDRCKEIGFSLAIDDFGTGYSSLSYLHRLPSDTLKIDRSFVVAMLASARSWVIVHFLVQLAQGLGMKTVAEGIDDPDTLLELTSMRVDLVQGFLLARPMPEADAREVLATRPTLSP